MALSATVSLSALDLPVRNVNGTDYYYYEVKPKESIYSITRKLGVSREDIVRCNPAVVDGVRPEATVAVSLWRNSLLERSLRSVRKSSRRTR